MIIKNYIQFISENSNVFDNYEFLEWSVNMSKKENNSHHEITFFYAKLFIRLFNETDFQKYSFKQIVQKVNKYWEKFKPSTKAIINNKVPLFFHGSYTPNIQKFNIKTDTNYRIGLWFSTNPNVAATFTPKKLPLDDYGNRIYPAYLIMNSPFIIDAKKNDYLEIPIPIEMKNTGNYSSNTVDTDLIAEFAYDNNYDGIIIKNVFEGSGNTEYSHVGVTFDNKNIVNLKNI